MRASIDWIGFESPQQHQARESLVNQAALSPEAGQPVAGAQAATPVRPAEPVESPAEPGRRVEPKIELPASFADMPVALQMEADTNPLLAVLPTPPQPTRTVAREPATAARQPVAEPAAPSDRESAAASRTAPTEISPGGVVSAAGLEIKTVRPKFDLLTRVVASPRNPLIQVSFWKSGRVANVEVLETSGSKSVDDPIVHAAFNWKASGQPLDELPDDREATIDVEIRILLRH